jgi:predicted ester cyclase
MPRSPADWTALKRQHLQHIVSARALAQGGYARYLAEACADDVVWCASCPVNEQKGRAAVAETFFRPLAEAFPDLERRTDILISGAFREGEWIASMGHMVGLFQNDLWGIPATGRPAWLRFGAVERLEGSRVAEAYWLLDLPSLMIQAGVWPLSPSLGAELLSPAPASHDGVSLLDRNEAEDRASLALVEAMIAGLMQYDGRSLASMGMRRFWTSSFHWYGPGGIGSMRGHEDYERGHQRPFLRAFPDRVGGNHKCRIGEGAYVASAGWPSIRATHLGGGWLGLAPTHKPVTIRVMDFWRREDAMLVENWVFIDVPDLLQQMGLDVFERLRERSSR